MYRLIQATLILVTALMSVNATATVYNETNTQPIPFSIENAEVDFGVPIIIPGPVESIDGVSIVLTFGKSDDTCAIFGAGNSRTGDMFYRLVSPNGTSVDLITPGSYNSNGPVVPLGTTVTFDDAAADLVGETNGGVPETGTFQPEDPLATFNGEDPNGTWTLFGRDIAPGQPLCHQAFSLTVSTTAGAVGGGGGGAGAEAAPTLSEWMLMLLALVLGGIGYTAAMKTRKN